MDEEKRTLESIAEEYFPDDPVPVRRLYYLLGDLDDAGAFVGGAWGRDDIMDNLKSEE